MKKVALIGAGNIGSRHLQALANVETKFDIYVVEPNIEALELSKERFEQIENSKNHQLFCCSCIDELPDELDLVTIATSSLPRFKIIEEVTSKKKTQNMLLEKFLFTEEESFYKAKEIFDRKEMKVWVNTIRRAYSFNKKLTEYLSDAKYVSMFETGGKWGLACNGIHILDFFSMIQGDSEEYIINTDNLDNVIYDSKRAGYIEFNGTLEISSNKGKALITCFSETDCPMTMNIHSDKGSFEIIEGTDDCTYRIPKNQFESNSCKMGNKPVSSELIKVYNDILEKGECDLPYYEKSMKLHLIFLKALLNKMNQITGNKENTICQIT